jgi:hypothetical protein
MNRKMILMKASWRAATLAVLAVGAVAFVPLAFGQGNWHGKPYQEWTKSDAEKLLTASPWVQTAAPSGAAIGLGGTNSVNAPDYAVTVRLRSALPVRQAILRLRQLREKYDQMSDAKKAEFDEKNKTLVECPACAENYVVALVPPPGGRVSLPRTLISTPMEKIKLFVQLTNERGERREIAHYAPPKSLSGEAVFFFPRNNDKGEPFLTPASKKVVLIIGPEILGSLMLNRFEFNVSKMIVDGNLEF